MVLSVIHQPVDTNNDNKTTNTRLPGKVRQTRLLCKQAYPCLLTSLKKMFHQDSFYKTSNIVHRYFQDNRR
jgi:hypothetical protein